MKKHIFLLVVLFVVSTDTYAQYKVNKTKYDYRTYTYQAGDPYKPGTAGVYSFLIPGSGQMACGETGRGLCFFIPWLGCAALFVSPILTQFNSTQPGDGSDSNMGLSNAGVAGMFGIGIWSIFDAVRVAKVNNLAFRDKNKTSYNFDIQPFVSVTNSFEKNQTINGVRLTIYF